MHGILMDISVGFNHLIFCHLIIVLFQFYAKVTVQHGSSVLSEVSTKPKPMGKSWAEWVDMNIPIQELPRAARFCFVIYRVCGRKKKKVSLILNLLFSSIFMHKRHTEV